MYQALYRTYRSNTFDDVYGQAVITTTLKNEINSGKASHAYLFTGLRGCGKTSCSKIIAKAVNCLNPQNGNPCCTCEICTGIDNDSITDVMEIDAASNSGVDYMRELREQAFYRPVRCKKRVYIIDEAHMLSTEAFNALLKIMEEPPEHVLFILATTEVHKVPATIISRCQRFDFKRIDPNDIADRLEFIANAEAFRLEREAALMIARLGDGSMRDSISLLDQCWSHTSEIDLQVVAECAGISSNESLFAISDCVLQGDCPGTLSALEAAASNSSDIQRLCEQLIQHFRNLMVARSTDNPAPLILCLPGELEQYRLRAANCPVARLLQILGQFQDAYVRMGRTPNKRVELEMAVVRVCDTLSAEPEGDGALEARIARLEAAIKAGVIPLPPSPPSPIIPEASAKPKSTPEPQSDELRKSAVPFPKWPEVLEKLGKRNQALHGALFGSNAYIADDLLLIDSRNELFLKLIRENEYARQNIHDCIIEVTGFKHRLGPYRADQYRVEEQQPDPLETLLKNADSLDIDIKILEN